MIRRMAKKYQASGFVARSMWFLGFVSTLLNFTQDGVMDFGCLGEIGVDHNTLRSRWGLMIKY